MSIFICLCSLGQPCVCSPLHIQFPLERATKSNSVPVTPGLKLSGHQQLRPLNCQCPLTSYHSRNRLVLKGSGMLDSKA
ncbi:hypothetical protein BC826DRAFT_991523 [Russula brevipes]|nr:hypothetical protein BC826DRAFT_991523 [Russula brevipes]